MTMEHVGRKTCERGCNVGVSIYETSVVVAEPDEAAKVDVKGGRRLIKGCRYIARVDRHPRRRDLVAQEAQLSPPKFALGGFDVQLFLTEDGQNLAHVRKVLFESGAVTEKVVHVDYDGPMKGTAGPWDPVPRSADAFRLVHVGCGCAETLCHSRLHDPHEYRRRALQPNRHDHSNCPS